MLALIEKVTFIGLATRIEIPLLKSRVYTCSYSTDSYILVTFQASVYFGVDKCSQQIQKCHSNLRFLDSASLIHLIQADVRCELTYSTFSISEWYSCLALPERPFQKEWVPVTVQYVFRLHRGK